MAWLTGCASFLITAYMILMMHPLPNNTWQAICCIAFATTFPILLCVASDREEKMNKRIKDLENELKNKEE